MSYQGDLSRVFPEPQPEQQRSERERLRRYKAKRRKQWADAGRCTECGAERKGSFLKCGYCLASNLVRVDRCVYKKRMAKAGLR